MFLQSLIKNNFNFISMNYSIQPKNLQVLSIVFLFFRSTSFSCSEVVVVTWSRVGAYNKNSDKVRLEVVVATWSIVGAYNKNSDKVRIEVVVVTWSRVGAYNTNSDKERRLSRGIQK